MCTKNTQVMNYTKHFQLTNGCGMMGNCFALHATRKDVIGSALASWPCQPSFYCSSSYLELSSWQLKVIDHILCNAMFISDSGVTLLNNNTETTRPSDFILAVKKTEVLSPIWGVIQCKSIMCPE